MTEINTVKEEEEPEKEYEAPRYMRWADFVPLMVEEAKRTFGLDYEPSFAKADGPLTESRFNEEAELQLFFVDYGPCRYGQIGTPYLLRFNMKDNTYVDLNRKKTEKFITSALDGIEFDHPLNLDYDGETVYCPKRLLMNSASVEFDMAGNIKDKY